MTSDPHTTTDPGPDRPSGLSSLAISDYRLTVRLTRSLARARWALNELLDDQGIRVHLAQTRPGLIGQLEDIRRAVDQGLVEEEPAASDPTSSSPDDIDGAPPLGARA